MNAITLDIDPSSAPAALQHRALVYGARPTPGGVGRAVGRPGRISTPCASWTFDRDITGYFPIQVTGNFDIPAALARHVMHMYDQGQYRLGAFHGIGEHLRDVRSLGYEVLFAAQGDAREVRTTDLVI